LQVSDIQDYKSLYNFSKIFISSSSRDDRIIAINKFFKESTQLEKDLFSKLYSLSHEIGRPLIKAFLSPSRQTVYGKNFVTLEEASGVVYYYLYLNYEYETFKSYYKSFPKELQYILYVFFSGIFQKMPQTFVYENVDRVFSLDYLLTNFIKLPKFLEDNSVEILQGSKKESPKFPFFIFRLKKKEADLRFSYLLKRGTDVVSNIKSRRLRNFILSSNTEVSYGVFLIENKKVRKKFPKYSIFPITKLPYDEAVNSLKNKNFKFSINKIDFEKNKYYSINKKLVLIKDKEEFKRYMKGYYKALIISENGIFNLSVSVQDNLFKIIDYVLDEYYEAVGVKYERDGEVLSANLKIDDNFKKAGLDTAYITIRDFIMLGEVIDSKPVSYINSTHPRECIKCGKLTSKLRSGVCHSCYYYLHNICKSNVDKRVIIQEKTHKEDLAINIEKYLVKFKGAYLLLERDFEENKGKQYSLPFEFPL